ncbi:MAG: NAD-binding protein [Pseudomonadota bacterium]
MRTSGKIARITLLRQFYQYKKGIKVFAFVLLFIMIFSTISLYFLEPASNKKVNFLDFFWTTVFTIVGAADFAEYHPSSSVGKLIIFLLSVCGIGIVGWIIAEIAGNFVLKKLKEALGMSQSKFKNHYVICGWNSHASIVTGELSKIKKPFVLVADIEENPLTGYAGENFFIKGDCGDEENLKKAGIEHADVTLILADKLGEKSIDDIDARTILVALTIEKLYKELNREGKKDITTVIELLNPKNEHHAKRANVDDIILYNAFAAKLFVTCALNKGISKIFADLLSFDEGNELYTREVPTELRGKTFDDAITYYRKKEALPIAIFNGDTPVINPASNEKLTESSRIVLIAKDNLIEEHNV